MKNVLIAAVLCLSHFALGKEPATQADLEALVAHAAFEELLERAEDVPVAARKDEWRAAVTRAAAASVSQRPTKEPFSRAARADALGERYRFLAEQPAFTSARDEAVVAGAALCLEEAEYAPCWKDLARLESTLSPAGSLTLGRLMRKNGFVPARVAPLFCKAVDKKDAPACREVDLQDVVLAGLDLPVDEDGARAARLVAFAQCWSVMQPRVKASLVGASSYRLRNSCKVMRERKALTELQADLCTDEGL